MDSENIKLLNFFDHIDDLKPVLKQRKLVVFLDYDGTLTPIVATPDLAIISVAMRQAVYALAQKVKVAIVSGRATADVKSKVNIDGIFYAGSHGFEICDPKGDIKINQEAEKIRPVIDEAYHKLARKVLNIRGALIENVKYTISAHYRLVADKDFVEFENNVDAVLAAYPTLRKTSGKKVFELRPKIDWHKGKAVQWILDIFAKQMPQNFPIYIGDDTTDEDAFRVLRAQGFGILVSAEPRVTEARYRVKDTEDVQKVLEALVQIC